jgi:hypothetical protein
MADTIELRPWRPTPAPPMTVPVLIGASVTGSVIAILLLAIDGGAPGRLAPIVRVADPAAMVLIGAVRLAPGPWLPVIAISVLMNAALYGMVALTALIAMTVAGIRSTFQPAHWLALVAITALLLVVRATLFPV